MMVKTKFRLKGAGRDSYLELVMAFPLASIKSDEQLQEAQKVMDQLLAGGALDDGEEMYLDALSDLVAAYEDEHYTIEPASDADMLRHLMEAKWLTQAQLSRDTAIPKSTISEILAGKKPFSRQMIRRLADYFGVDASVLAANFLKDFCRRRTRAATPDGDMRSAQSFVTRICRPSGSRRNRGAPHVVPVLG
jgi:HTH-type transcriptional regulator/antitoxin HigA